VQVTVCASTFGVHVALTSHSVVEASQGLPNGMQVAPSPVKPAKQVQLTVCAVMFGVHMAFGSHSVVELQGLSNGVQMKPFPVNRVWQAQLVSLFALRKHVAFGAQL
jgi:hypothetical protein